MAVLEAGKRFSYLIAGYHPVEYPPYEVRRHLQAVELGEQNLPLPEEWAQLSPLRGYVRVQVARQL